jgi:hypothetical protein
MDLTPLLAKASADNIEPEPIALLATDAAARARELLAQQELTDLPATMDEWTDAVRLAATYPDEPCVARLGPASSQPERMAYAVAAWQYGGRTGLDTLAAPWQPPKQAHARARTALDEVVADGLLDDGTELTAWRNRWTVVGRGLQLRYGTDGRWYPYVEDAGNWRPAGPPHIDPVTTLIELAKDPNT